MFRTIPTIRRRSILASRILFSICLVSAVTVPCLALSEPFPDFIAAFEKQMELELSPCPEELEGTMGDYILWCGETDLDSPAFRKSWKKAKNRIRGLQQNLNGGWSTPQPGLQRLSFWLFDNRGILLFNAKDRLLIVGLDSGPASCDQAGYGDRNVAKVRCNCPESSH